MRVAIIGGGIVGLSTAYFLAKNGIDVSVFERKYLVYGASGRNPGGITAQMENEFMIKLALESMRLYDEIQSEIGFNFLLRRDGYLKIADEKDAEKLENEVKFQRRHGVDVEILQPEEVKEIFPDINTESFSIASYFADGCIVFPWAVIWGLAKGCRDLGVKIYDYTPAKVVVEKGEVVGVKAKELHRADFVVNAAGAWSNEISREAGVELGNKIVKEEICVTESLKPYINPYILDISSGIYVTQTVRGEVIGGIVGSKVNAIDFKGSLNFLIRYAKRVTQLIPKLKGLSVLRQWTGVYDVGKNGLPVIGFTKVKGFIQANGFGRNGMSTGLAAGKALAEMITKGKSKLLAHV